MSVFLQEPADGNSQAAWDCSELFSAHHDLEEPKEDKSRLPQAVGGVIAAGGISLALMGGTAHAAESHRSESAVMQTASNESNTTAKNTKNQNDAASSEATKPALEARTNVSSPDSSKIAAATREVVTENNEPKPRSPALQTESNNGSDKKASAAPTPVTTKPAPQNQNDNAPISRSDKAVVVDASPNTAPNDALRTDNPKIVANPINKPAHQRPSDSGARSDPAPDNDGRSPLVPVQPMPPVPPAEAPKKILSSPAKVIAAPVDSIQVVEKLIEKNTGHKATPPAIFSVPAQIADKQDNILTGNNAPSPRLTPPAIISFVGLPHNTEVPKPQTPLPEAVASSPAPPPPAEAPAPPPPEPPKAPPAPVPLEQRGFTAAGETLSPPLDSLRKTSGFGRRWGRQHEGIDFGAPRGTPVKAMDDGVVLKVGYDRNGYGKFVEIDHGDGITTLAAHLDTTDVAPRQRVEKQQLIGGVGNTGHSRGNHLHQEIRINGVPKNPEPYILKGQPLPGTKAPEPELVPVVEAASEPAPEAAPVPAAAPPVSAPEAGSLPLSKTDMPQGGVSTRTQAPASRPPILFYARPATSNQPLFTAADVPSSSRASSLATNIHSGAALRPKINMPLASALNNPVIPAVVSPVIPRLSSPAPRVTAPLPPAAVAAPEAPTATVPIQDAFTPPPGAVPAPVPEAAPAPPQEVEVHPELSVPSTEPNITSLNEEAVPERYRAAIKKAAAEHGWPAALLAAQLRQESNFNENAVSRAGAKGPSQFMPLTWKALGKDVDGDGNSPNDIEDAIDAQARYMRGLEDNAKKLIAEGKLSGDPTRAALTSYNWGTGKLKAFGRVPSPADAGKRYIYQGKSRKVSAEAAQYAEKILNWANGYGYTGR